MTRSTTESNSRPFLRVLAGLGAALLLAATATAAKEVKGGPATGAAATAETTALSEYPLRVVDDAGRSVSLDIATWRFTHDDGPDVLLVGVAHIADRTFYRDIQAMLDASDVVLYESVLPAGAGGAGGENDEERVASTERAIELLASLVEAYGVRHGKFPVDHAELIAFISNVDARLADAAGMASNDGWGAPVEYEREDGGFRLSSRGADRKSDADDIVVSAGQVTPASFEGEEGIQAELANALDLEFQLTGIDYDRESYRCSDMAADELEVAFRERGLDFTPLATSLGGTSLPARFATAILRMIRVLDAMMDGALADTAKVMLIELIGDPTMMEQGLEQFGEGFAEVLIDLRNQVPVDDLERIMNDEPEVETVAIFYGAAHLPDMAERLVDQLGYQPAGEEWLRAIEVDLTTSSVDPKQMMQMRMMIRRMMQR